MALSAFDDRSKPPREDELAATLGPASAAWNELRRRVATRFAPLSEAWGFSGKSTGWGLRLGGEKRAILYMTPCRGYFLASFALGEKAVKAARDVDLPASVWTAIDGAKRYAEGRGVRLEVRRVKDLAAIEKLAIVKMAN
jgi:hypothetical protein